MPIKTLLLLLSLGILVVSLPAADLPRTSKSIAPEGTTAAPSQTGNRTNPALRERPAQPSGLRQLQNLSSSSLTFIENRGQFDERVRFQLKTHGQIVWVTNTGITFDTFRARTENSSFLGAKGAEQPKASKLHLPKGLIDPKAETPSLDRLAFSEDFVGAKCCPKVQGLRAQPGLYNYFFGNDPAKWQTKVPGFSEVRLQDVWPGIDLRIYGNGPNLEQEFIVRPGGNLDNVQVAYRGIDGLSIAKDGSLEINTAFGKLRETEPRMYQQILGQRVAVGGHFKLTSNSAYAFEVEAHDAEYALVIDPTLLLYSTYLGGSAGDVVGGPLNEFASGVAVDASGSAYIAGSTLSPDFPTTPGAFQPSVTEVFGIMKFITKLNATGSALVYSTYLGSYAGINGTGIAVDSAGNAYVTGETDDGTYGHSFPTTSNASSPNCYSRDIYLTEFNPTGDQLLYSTCIGVPALDIGISAAGIAVDSHGRAFIAGTVSGAIPTTSNAFQQSFPGVQTGFLMVFDTMLSGTSSLTYSSYFGRAVGINAIAVDSFGKLYVTGGVSSDGLPVTPGAFQATHSPCVQGIACPSGDAFVAKLDPSASGSQSLIYSTYLGGPGSNNGKAIAVDSSGNAYVTGNTLSRAFPVTLGAFQTIPYIFGEDYVSFVTELNAGGSRLLYSTYLEGACNPCFSLTGVYSVGIAVDSLGDAYVVGSTQSAVLPVTLDAYQTVYNKPGCGTDCPSAFLTKFNPTGSALLYSSYLEGSNQDIATAIAVDQAGDAYVAGYTSSIDFPTTVGVFQPVRNGTGDAFVTKFPLGTTFRVLNSVPSIGGNAGFVTVTVNGEGFHAGVTVVLRGVGPDIVAKSMTVGTTGRTMSATFDLRGVAVGTRDVIVTNTDGASVTLPQAFTIVQGGAPQIWVDIIGRPQIWIGSEQQYSIVVGNSGNVDAVGVPIWVQVPSNVELGIGFDITQPPSLLPSAVMPSLQSGTTVPYQVTVSNNTIAGFYKPYVPAGSTQLLPITLAVNSAIAPFQWNAWVFPPYLASATGTFVATNPTGAKKCTVDLASLLLTGGFGASSVLLESVTTLINFSLDTPGIAELTESTYQIFTEIAKDDGEPLFNASQLAALSGFGDGLAIGNAIKDCAPFANIIFKTMTAEPISSGDPNDKFGLQGVGMQRYILGMTPVDYAIQFGNEPTANAPAAKVVVTDQLDLTKDDPTTLSLGPIAFGGQLVTPPPFQTTFSTTVDLRPATNLLVAVNSNLNSSTGLLTWNFQSLDPATGLPPTDLTVGFLPPGGNGSVFFTVNPKKGLPTNTQIQNQATIVFDVNAPINTPTWFNTLDSTPPTSHVTALPASEATANFTVKWSGSDVGSGIGTFTIYVSDNGGPFTAFLTNMTATSATFTGQASHTYGFYSIATDAVGNVEPGKTVAEANTTLASAVVLSTAQISTTTSGLVYSRVSKTFNGTVTIKNISTNTFNGPFQILFTSLPTGVTTANGTGSFNGSPFITVPTIASLAPGKSATINIQFTDPSNAKINFTPVIYSGSF